MFQDGSKGFATLCRNVTRIDPRAQQAILQTAVSVTAGPPIQPTRQGIRMIELITPAQDMPEQYVPDNVRAFILKHIASVAQIEALLLIWSSPEERWGLSQIAARIYTSEPETAKALDCLCADGLLICLEGTFRLNASAENIEMIGRLKEVYARHLIPVTDVIHGKSRSPRPTAETFGFRKE